MATGPGGWGGIRVGGEPPLCLQRPHPRLATALALWGDTSQVSDLNTQLLQGCLSATDMDTDTGHHELK